ncbi:MAG TPA: Na(+)/H(+) antiporter subunit A, partial [Bdellovibrionales bacterium]|nr:Na(+)/H(+) antiporter subunit A [Bdellovibrionales bacterium]
MGSPTNWLLALIPLLLSVCIAFWIPELSRGEVVRMGTTWVPELNINLSFALDGLSAIFALLITVLGTIVVVYAGPYFENHRDLGRFYVLLLSFMASMLGLVLSDNVILLYIFWELTTFTSFLLIGFENENKEARKNAWQAILVTTAGGLALLAGLLLLGRIGGSYEISTLLANGSTIRDHHLQLPTLILILIGAFTKSAQFPFHFWLPNAMVAPTPVSAYLHSATMVKAGIYLLARFFPIFGNTETWFYVVSTTGVLTMLTGSFMALKQTDLKLLLAYMTIMALGALTLLLGIGNKEAITAAVGFLI